MVAENMTVKITVDTTKLTEQLRKVAEATARINASWERLAYDMRAIGLAGRRTMRTHARAWYTDGEHHIESVMQEILAGVPGRDPALRLMCASDIADILDRAA